MRTVNEIIEIGTAISKYTTHSNANNVLLCHGIKGLCIVNPPPSRCNYMTIFLLDAFEADMASGTDIGIDL